jgi:hypothetical protein
LESVYAGDRIAGSNPVLSAKHGRQNHYSGTYTLRRLANT